MKLSGESLRLVSVCFAILGVVFGRTTLDDVGDDGVLPGEFIVVLSEANAAEALAGFRIINKQTAGPNAIVLVEADETELQDLEMNPAVESVECNHIIALIEPVETLADDELYLEDYDLLSAEAFSLPDRPTCLLRQSFVADYAWGSIRTSYRQLPDYFTDPYTYAYRGAGVDVYVLDTGVDITHVIFDGRASHGMMGSVVSSEGPEDFQGHGTHVAGTVAGRLLGVADQANIISVKVLSANGSGVYSDVIEGVNWVTEQVKEQRSQGKTPRAIINMSLGGSDPLPALYKAIQGAVEQGIPVIVAAGNDAEGADYHYPAGYNHTITVAATNKTDTLAEFSNYGEGVDLSAPGVRIVSAGSSNMSLCVNNTAGRCLVLMSGTSQATPHVAGIVARHLGSLSNQELERQTTDAVRDMLLETATKGRVIYQNRNQSYTPNRLLYRECAGILVDPAMSTEESYVTTTGVVETFTTEYTAVETDSASPALTPTMTEIMPQTTLPGKKTTPVSSTAPTARGMSLVAISTVIITFLPSLLYRWCVLISLQTY